MIFSSETKQLLIDLSPLILVTFVAHFIMWWVLRDLGRTTYRGGVKAAFVAFCRIKGVIPSQVVEAMKTCEVTPSDVDNDPAIIAVLERDRETKKWIEEDRIKQPDHEFRGGASCY